MSLNVVGRSLLHSLTSVVVGVNEGMLNLMPCRNERFTFLNLLILVVHFTLVILIFYPQNLNLLFAIINDVSIFSYEVY